MDKNPMMAAANARANVLLELERALECLRIAEKEATREHTRVKSLMAPGYRWLASRGPHPAYVQKEVEKLARATYLLIRKVERVG